MYEPFTCAGLLQAWQAAWCGRRLSRLSLDAQRALHKLQGELAHEILARDLMNYPKNPHIYGTQEKITRGISLLLCCNSICTIYIILT